MNPTDSLKFRWPWRPSQARVLDALDRHISDRKLHIVAAPGAGKTTLGLEMFRRLGKPALALAPTRTIRDQWINRLQDFAPGEAEWPPTWISTDLDAPGFFTSITYQALHTRYREDELPDEEMQTEAPTRKELDILIERLRAVGVGTLILDEAHHLRAEWWKALIAVMEAIPDLALVSLTATPPYDVTGHEWDRYQELCGPIDEEISVPELVKAGTLCPHQDYVWAMAPLPDDVTTLRDYDHAIEQLQADLLADETFAAAVRAHPFISDPQAHVIVEAPEVATAMLVYLKARQETPPPALLRLLDTRAAEIPVPTRYWWQILIRAYLFAWPGEVETEHQTELKQRLRRQSLLYRHDLRLDESRPIKRQLSLSAAKLTACVAIYQLEKRIRGTDLRQVILTDFIRDEDVDDATPALTPQLGSWPVFRALVMSVTAEEQKRMAVLTGRLAVAHSDKWKALLAIEPTLKSSPLPSLPGFLKITAKTTGDLTSAFTQLLVAGELHVLVGTRSLLGEGWDAPVLNSLVLGSFVGSFMLTNQMRGRAIRVDKQRPDKASSIWHLVAIHPESSSGMTDFEDLQRRFKTFVGLAEQQPRIESGLERLNIRNHWKRIDLEKNNAQMAERLSHIDTLKARWQEAIGLGMEARVLPSIVSAETYPAVRVLHIGRMLGAALFTVLAILLFLFAYGLQGDSTAGDLAAYVLMGAVVLAVGAAAPWLFKATLQFVRYWRRDGVLRQIGLTVRDALCAANLIETTPRRLGVNSTSRDDGSFALALTGGTFYEQSLFADSLREVLGVVENPRYLLIRRGTWWQWRRIDYHAVPHTLGTNKDLAALFLLHWEKRISPAELIYTRTTAGRQTLLKARGRALSTTATLASAERQDRWQ